VRKQEFINTFIVLGLLILVAFFFTRFLEFHEKRTNELALVFDDPAYHLLRPIDLSVLIFSLTYGSIVLYIALNYRTARFALRAILCYAFLLLLRIPTLTFVPLKVHPELIHLRDPFLNELVYPTRITNDLFFSGHVGLMCIFFLISRKRMVFLILGFFVGSSLIIQRVHYSIDVLAAIPFGWLAVKLADMTIQRTLLSRID
jgi:membrane-associated phospholipid phosphatase